MADNTGSQREWLIPEEGQKHLRDIFKGLKGDVHLMVFAKDVGNSEENDEHVYDKYMRQFATDLSELSDKISATFTAPDGEEAKQYGITHTPALLVNPESYSIKFTGAPLGEEARALIESIFLTSLGSGGLSDNSHKFLGELKEERVVKVFSSPGCPYCPGQFMNAVKCAIEKPELVKAEMVNSDEFPELSEKYGVGSVPHTVINEEYKQIGMMPEERFVLEMLMLRDAEDLMREAQQPHEHDAAKAEEYDVIILGAGPAGLTAGIYAERAGLNSIVLDKSVVGGQVTTTPIVENYPGFKNVGGMNLVEMLTSHTREYSNVHENEPLREIKIGKKIEVYTDKAIYTGKALIFATGAEWRHLGITGEDTYYGTGVSQCASCDGYMFKNKKIVMVGGGNSALTDALHLKNLGVDVTIVHRRDSFRAEQALQESVEREKIAIIWNTVVTEVKGDGKNVTGVMLENVMDGTTTEFACDGMFVAIGLNANTQDAAELGVHLNKDGTIKVDRSMRTNIPRVYAAGDVTGGVRQIVTAVGEGATAALSVFEDLQNPYWKSGGKTHDE